MHYNFTMDWQIRTLIHYPRSDYQYNSMLSMQQELFIFKKVCQNYILRFTVTLIGVIETISIELLPIFKAIIEGIRSSHQGTTSCMWHSEMVQVL